MTDTVRGSQSDGATERRAQIGVESHGRVNNVAWLHLQPTGAVSFGMNDRMLAAQRLGIKSHIFNGYTRIPMQWVLRDLSADEAGLNPIKKPHFTFHPCAWFHLTGNKDDKGEHIFEGLADMSIVLQQQSEWQWIRVVSRPVISLNEEGRRHGGAGTDIWTIMADDPTVSLRIAVDLTRVDAAIADQDDPFVRFLPWQNVGVRVVIDTIPGMKPTFAWNHEL